MNIRNHILPPELIATIQSKILQREVGSWQLKSEFDSFENLLETELGEFFSTEKEILDASEKLPCDFTADGDYGESDECEYPGGISTVNLFYL